MAEAKTSLWNEAGRAGLILGGVSIAFLAVNALLEKLHLSGLPAGLLSVALWAGKLGLTLYILVACMRRFTDAAGKLRSRAFGFGVAASLCAGLVYGAAYFAYVAYVNPESVNEAFDSVMQMYSSQLTSDQLEAIANTRANFPTIAFFIQLIWCTLLGAIFSAIISGRICGSDDPFDDDED